MADRTSKTHSPNSSEARSEPSHNAGQQREPEDRRQHVGVVASFTIFATSSAHASADSRVGNRNEHESLPHSRRTMSCLNEFAGSVLIPERRLDSTYFGPDDCRGILPLPSDISGTVGKQTNIIIPFVTHPVSAAPRYGPSCIPTCACGTARQPRSTWSRFGSTSGCRCASP